jgi:hypothetical protein
MKIGKVELGKAELEKAGLGGIMLAALLYVYFSMLLGPLADQEKKAGAAIKDLEPKIAAAKAQVAKTHTLETKAPAARTTLDNISALIPDGAPVAWFPPRIQDFFKRQGIEKSSVRLNNEFAERELPGFRKLFWSIELPKIEVIPLGVAIAALENEEPLLEITNVQIEANKDTPQFPRATLTVATIVKQ